MKIRKNLTKNKMAFSEILILFINSLSNIDAILKRLKLYMIT